ncbi:MAG: zinc ribbon domain-containing protein [Anaerolineaceae bacterium]|nr:MAG: zinc ribbon domain-containing protein [Anaerolineaceae bacterium]
MDLGSLLVILALSLMAAAFIAQPLMGRRGLGVMKEERHLSELLAERDRVLTTLQDLDMDFAMGKVLQEDYQTQRGMLVRYGAEILREMDELRGTVGEVIPETDLEVEIESAVARLRRGEDHASGETCSSCGREVIAGDRFCVHCGASLLEEGT